MADRELKEKTELLFRYPFGWMIRYGERRALIIIIVLTLLVMFCMRLLDSPLKTESAPQGIVSFELAGDLSNSKMVINSWNSKARVYAGLSLGLDYLFLVLYTVSIGSCCIIIARRIVSSNKTIGFIGAGIAWAMLAAGLLDAAENFALIELLLGSEESYWPGIARWCAIPKFGIVALGLLYLILGGISAIVIPKYSRGAHDSLQGVEKWNSER